MFHCDRPCAHFSHMAHCTEVRFAIFLSGGFTNTAVINPPETKLAKRTSVHCRGLVPKDRRSFLPRWEVGHEEGSDFCSAPLRGHIPFSFIALYSTMEEDRNLGSLLPARCCCKAHASTGSSLSLSSSSDSYIVIKSPGTLYPWVFLIVFLLLDGVIAGGGVAFAEPSSPWGRRLGFIPSAVIVDIDAIRISRGVPFYVFVCRWLVRVIGRVIPFCF